MLPCQGRDLLYVKGAMVKNRRVFVTPAFIHISVLNNLYTGSYLSFFIDTFVTFML